MNNNKPRLDKGDHSRKILVSEAKQNYRNQERNSRNNETPSLQNFIKLWKFNKSEIITLKSLIELNDSATCLIISQLCNSYHNTVYTALKKLKKKGIIKKDDHKWYFVGKDELQRILSLRVQELINILFDES